MRYVIVDLEATCWEKDNRRKHVETIEIGAVWLDDANGPEGGEFSAFVRPVVVRALSAFCTELTSIRQEDVDASPPFPEVFARFVEWMGDAPYRLCSWGSFDLKQLQRDCKRHKLSFPRPMYAHINLRQVFAAQHHSRPGGMKDALAHLHLPLEGRPHRALDDARNTARIARILLPAYETRRRAAQDRP